MLLKALHYTIGGGSLSKFLLLPPIAAASHHRRLPSPPPAMSSPNVLASLNAKKSSQSTGANAFHALRTDCSSLVELQKYVRKYVKSLVELELKEPSQEQLKNFPRLVIEESKPLLLL